LYWTSVTCIIAYIWKFYFQCYFDVDGRCMFITICVSLDLNSIRPRSVKMRDPDINFLTLVYANTYHEFSVTNTCSFAAIACFVMQLSDLGSFKFALSLTRSRAYADVQANWLIWQRRRWDFRFCNVAYTVQSRLHRPENDILHYVNFWMFQHVIKRPYWPGNVAMLSDVFWHVVHTFFDGPHLAKMLIIYKSESVIWRIDYFCKFWPRSVALFELRTF